MSRRAAAVAAAAALAVPLTLPLVGTTSTAEVTAPASGSPIAAPDPQDWTDQAEMTWDDYASVRPAEWDSADTSEGSDVQYRTAVILLEFSDQPFLITQDPLTHPFGNPASGFQPVATGDVNQWFYDYYATPNEYNGGQTLHGYWMEDSHGRIGVDVEVFGPYTLPGKLHEYGYDRFNQPVEEFCPQGDECGKDIREAGFAAWHEDMGGCEEQLCGFDNGFWVTAGHDETSTWEEFGQMMFESPEDVPDELGPPRAENGEAPLNQNGDPMPNWAATRYVEWTSWQSAANHWPNAGGGTSTQAESSGLGVFAHEFSHLRGLPDNYNNPFADDTRNYTGYWEMMSRGSFNGPGGTHNRWQIPNAGGSALGPHHMLHYKQDLGVLTDDDQVLLTRSELAEQGPAVATLKARSSVPESRGGSSGKVGLEVTLDGGYTAGQCAADTPEDPDFWCPDGTGWTDFTMEVVDRVGNDSFTAGHGVLLAQNQPRGTPREWLVDANPENIDRIDYYRPDGTPVPVVRGDPRQLDDGTFHAGTESGSAYEYVDEPNNLHLYVLDAARTADGELTYDVAVRNLDAAGPARRGVRLGRPEQHPVGAGTALVNVPLRNTGEAGEGVFDSDVYRVSASVRGHGWDVSLPYEVTAVEAGGTLPVSAYATASDGAARAALLTLTVTSESDPSVARTVRVPLRAKAPKARSLSALVADYRDRDVLTGDESRRLGAHLRAASGAPGGSADAALARFAQDAEGLADVGQRNLAAAALSAAAGDLREAE
ncbi:M6 family metalloprotease domain-containing protein [Promicromonospora umidemergens]|uniref:M6 family metalloprotease domain-containing protein n=1 Tax=Promicromonospora umidemergens TaxID=629679 RepID=A0ABP8WDA5_9MICO|nr:M6 family metalloprotease domain-containing protein [Promicromonospora umidemergens]MCP2284411.1 M6 family metalloprotease domain-containing protein [Promicromonospora umidemergens]